MITPSTHPGCEVVCVRAGAFAHGGWFLADQSGCLVEGQTYRVAAIHRCDCFGEFYVQIEGVMPQALVADGCGFSFHRARFRRAHLPSALTDILEQQRIGSPDRVPVPAHEMRRGRVRTEAHIAPGPSCAAPGGVADAQSEFLLSSHASRADLDAMPSGMAFPFNRFTIKRACQPSDVHRGSSVSTG